MGANRFLEIILGLLLTIALCWANSKFDANNFLQKYGYLDDLTPGESGHSEASTNEAVKEFQRFNGLQPTGRLDAPTVRKMQQPRCGLPDVIKPSLRTSDTAGDHGRRRRGGKNRRNLGKGARGRRQDQPLAFYAPGYKWEKRDIKYNVTSYTRQLNQRDQLVAMRNAFQKWTDVAPLNIREVTSGAADIVINFFRGAHSAVDGAGNAFDGRGGVLAHAFFPGASQISGDTHFDEDEEWTLGTARGTNLEIVAAHEFGHALGLGHSGVRTALMAPYYQGYKADLKLEPDDISGIQSLYGSGKGSTVGSTDGGGTPQTPRPTPSTTTTPPPTGRFCNVTFDDIDRAYDGTTYGFSGDKVYKIGPAGITQRQNLGDVFQGAPPSPGAVVYDPYKRILFIFKGTRYWRFTSGFKLDSGYPKTLPPDFQNPRAAFIWSDGQLYLFLSGDMFVRWAEGLTRPWPGVPPLPVRNYFQGAPTNIEAAFKDEGDFYYFFKGTRYWKFNSRAVLQPGYPKEKGPAWLSCGQYQPR